MEMKTGYIFKFFCKTTGLQSFGHTESTLPCELALAHRHKLIRSQYKRWLENKTVYRYKPSYIILEKGNYQLILCDTINVTSSVEFDHLTEILYIENNECVNKNNFTRTQEEYFGIIRTEQQKKMLLFWVEQDNIRKEERREYYQRNKILLIQKIMENRVNNNPLRTREVYIEFNEDELKELKERKKLDQVQRRKNRNKQYYEDNKEKLNEQGKAYRENNKESERIRSKLYKENHKEQTAEYDKEYYQLNKVRINQKAKEKRGRNIEKNTTPLVSEPSSS
jgi:hypothetical protein